MPRPTYSNVRLTIYVLPETAERIRALAGRGPLGHPVDEIFAALEMPVANARAVVSPRVYKRPSSVVTAIPTVPHPIACECDTCTLARLRSPQIRKK